MLTGHKKREATTTMPEEKWQKLSCRSSLAVSRVFRGFEGYTEEPESIGAVRAWGGSVACVVLRYSWIKYELKANFWTLFFRQPAQWSWYQSQSKYTRTRAAAGATKATVKIFMFTSRVCISCVLPSWPQIECCSNNLSNFFSFFLLFDRKSSTASLAPSAPPRQLASCVWAHFSPVPFLCAR